MSNNQSSPESPKVPRKPSSLALSRLTGLIVDPDEFQAAITAQLLRGFGMTQQAVFSLGKEAQKYLERHTVDLCLIEQALPDISGAELTRWIRRHSQTNRDVAILVMTGFTHVKNVLAARDCGAHLVVKKPVAAGMLFDRIAWAARRRQFVESGDYLGPDRRFKFTGPPDGVFRRATDLKGELGDAIEPNLSQNELDAFVRPTKVTLQ